MEKVSDTNVKFMGPEATNGIWRLSFEFEPLPELPSEEEGIEPVSIDDTRYA